MTSGAGGATAAQMSKALESGDQRIAVIGLAIRYAGCSDKEQFWDFLCAGKVGPKPVSAERLGVKTVDEHVADPPSKLVGADGIVNPKYGTVETAMSEHELLLQIARDALADAGHPNVGSKCGIVSGALSFPRDGMQHVLMDVYQRHVEHTFGGCASLADPSTLGREWIQKDKSGLSPGEHAEHTAIDCASFVADRLGLSNGAPRLCLDAACASALYCMKLAQDYLTAGQADLMLCGASCFPEPMFVLSGFSSFKALPGVTSGLPSAPFETGTAGLTPGEGGAIFVLKRLADAERDGDRVYGTLLGTDVTNSGTGLPLKPHMESELDCLQRTYKKFNVDPTTLQYMECHATGTPQGDAAELEMIRLFYGDERPMPLIGSTKGNFGHTLTAAGFAGATKVLLGMNKGIIPCTPMLTRPMHQNVCAENKPWPDVHPQVGAKRAGLSAFGFGGTNAHAIFEEYKPGSGNAIGPHPAAAPFSPAPRLAIVGMAGRFGELQDLVQFERAVYVGGDGSRSLPPKRWRFLGEDSRLLDEMFSRDAGSIRGCFIEKVDVDYGRLKLPLLPEDQLQPLQLLALSTIDRALIDAGSAVQTGQRVAVLIGLGTDMELYRHRARVALRERLGLSPGDELTTEQEQLLNCISDVSTSTSYTSNIGNIIATRIASAWHFVGPAFTITQGANSVFRCLEQAQLMLARGEVEAAVIGGVDLAGSLESIFARALAGLDMATTDLPQASFEKSAAGFFVGEGAGALVLKRQPDCGAGERVYACIDAVAEGCDVEAGAHAALAAVGLTPDTVGYIELSGDGPGKVDDDEVIGIASAYTTGGTAKCLAVGTVKATVGHTGYASGAAALIKTALCLHNRYLPVLPRWQAPKPHMLHTWEGSSMYTCPESRPWLTNAGGVRRAAVSGVSATAPGSHFHVLLSDAGCTHEEHNLLSLDPLQPKLLTIRGQSVAEIEAALSASLVRIGDGAGAAKAAEAEFARLLIATVESERGAGTAMRSDSSAAATELVLCLVTTADKLEKELQFAVKHAPAAAVANRDFVTPSGSYFTPKPLRSAKVSFMYGDGASPYAGLGKDLHRIAPGLHAFVEHATTKMWDVSDEAWNVRGVTDEECKAKAAAFVMNQVANFRAGVYHSVCCTHVAREVLCIAPKAAFGLSMGEVAALFAFTETNSRKSDQMISRLLTSPVWTSQLAVKFDALRTAWGVSADAPVSTFWSGYVVHAPRDTVLAGINALGASASCVRLIIVNDTRTCIVAGKPDQCDALFKHLGVQAVPFEQGMVGHCPEVKPHAGGIAAIHDFLVVPDVADAAIFSSAKTGTVAPFAAKISAGHSMGELIGALYTEEANFVGIVGAVASEGFDVFIELGANDNRAAAVRDILSAKGSAHTAVAMDRKGQPAWRQLLKLAANLISHGNTGCKVDALYHPDAIAKAQRLMNAAKPTLADKLRKVIEINGRYMGMKPRHPSAAGASPRGGDGIDDGLLLTKMKRVPSSNSMPRSPSSSSMMTRSPSSASMMQRSSSMNRSSSMISIASVPSNLSLQAWKEQGDAWLVDPPQADLASLLQAEVVDGYGAGGLHLSGGFRGPMPPAEYMCWGKPVMPSIEGGLTWHPLAGKDGNPTPGFTPTSFPPRPIAFVPFPGNPNDTNHTPGVLPLSWVNMCEFMCNKLSCCLGPEYSRFDTSTSSRSPAFDLALTTRVLSVSGMETEPGNNKWYNVDCNPGTGTMVAEFDCPADAWFFEGSSSSDFMPYSIFMEIALQTCGVLTTWNKAPLTLARSCNTNNILFRNLDGTAKMIKHIDLRGKTIRNTSTATGYSMLGEMGVQKFKTVMTVDGGEPFYEVESAFGWFLPAVFQKQIGLDSGKTMRAWHLQSKNNAPKVTTYELPADEPRIFAKVAGAHSLQRRSAQCSYLDFVDFIANSGRHGKGYIRGFKHVDPRDWFFSCHFWCDSVMPGSLGVESMIQALELFSVEQGYATGIASPCFAHDLGVCKWKYRGQLTPKNKVLECEVHVKKVERVADGMQIVADGFLLVDSLRVYQTTDLRLKIVQGAEAAAPVVIDPLLAAVSPW